MHLRLEFILTFESDWHINAGFGVDGKADAVLERDPQGKSIISGTTLKGVLRDALHDLALNLGQNPDDVTGILGAPGYDSRWYVSAASPQAKSIRESMIATGIRVDPRYRRAEDNKYFKRELGAAEVFAFSVTGTTADDKALEEVEWLVAAMSYIERLGGRRRRGNGKCIISLVNQELHKEILKSFATRHCGETHKIDDEYILAELQAPMEEFQITPHTNPSHRYRIILYTERPVIISEKPEAGNVYWGQIVIPGSTLRGAFAELARPGDLQANDSTKYDEFKRLFVLGGLKFGHLNPLEVNDDVGIPIAQVPLGLQQVEDTFDCCFTSVFQKISKHKAFSGWVRLQDGLQTASYATESHIHNRINPDLKRASDGDLYTYEAIPAGQYYIGEIYLEDADWQSIGELLQVNIGQPFELRIGKGRNRSYGQVKVVIAPMDEDDPPTWIHVPLEQRLKATAENELYITLATDTILQDTWGRFYGCFDCEWLASLLELENDMDIQIIAADDKRPAQVVRTKLIDSFDTRSGLPRWRDKALVAGSTARLVFANGRRPSTDVLKRLEAEGVGLRRGEGFGRVIFNHPAHTRQWSGFAGSVDISAIRPSHTTSETPQQFALRWESRLRELDMISDEISRSLARQLMQWCSIHTNMESDKNAHRTAIDHIITQIESAETKTMEKDVHEKYKQAADTVKYLLGQARDEGEHWRKAVILLAEALMNNRGKD